MKIPSRFFKVTIFVVSFLCAVFGIFSSARADSWEYIGPWTFAATGLQVVFHPGTHEPWVLTENPSVMRFDGQDWLTVGSSNALGFFLYFDAVTHDPYVVGDDFVKRFNGSDWVVVAGTPLDTNNGIFSSGILYNPVLNGPCMAYTDQYGDHGISVSCYNGGVWNLLGNEDFALSYGTNDSIAMNSATGELYVSFADAAHEEKITIMRYNGSAWVVVGSPGFVSAVWGHLSLGFDGSDLFIAFVDDDWNMAVRRFIEGTGWVDVGALISVPGSKPVFSRDPVSGRLILAHQYFEQTFLSRFDGTQMVTFVPSYYSWASAYLADLVFHPVDQEPYILVNEPAASTLLRYHFDEVNGGESGEGGGTNLDGSKYSYNYYPVTLNINATIAISCDSSVAMDAIVGTGKSDITLAGTKATDNVAMCNVKTNASGGYKMEWNSSATHEASGALKSTTNASDTISGYTMTASSETWSVSPTASEWGAKLGASSEGYGTGNGGGDYSYASAGGWGLDDGYANGKWMNVPTNAFQIMQKSTETDVDGEYQYLVFGAEIGADKLQPTGTYTQEVTVTATTL